MKIVHVGDTHSDHEWVKKIPREGDIFIYSGDYTSLKSLKLIDKDSQEYKEVYDKYLQETEWLNKVFSRLKNNYGYKEVLFVPGNHDLLFENNLEISKKILNSAVVLINESFKFGGIKFYGTPATAPWFSKTTNRHVWNLKFYELLEKQNLDIDFDVDFGDLTKLTSKEYIKLEKIVQKQYPEVFGYQQIDREWGLLNYNWAFTYDNPERFKIFQKIPHDTDILISHASPLKDCDNVLLNELKRKKSRIKLVFCGHEHVKRGRWSIITIRSLNVFKNKIKSYNTSYKNVYSKIDENSIVRLIKWKD